MHVDPVELGVGDYDTAFKCQVLGSYDCVIKISNNNLRPDWHPNLIKLKRAGAVEYVTLLSVATYSNMPAFCSGFEKELKVAKRLFEPFPSSSRQHFFLTIEEARHTVTWLSCTAICRRTPVFNMLTGFCVWSWRMKGCPCWFQSGVIRRHIPCPDKGCIQTALREHGGTWPGRSSLALITCCGEGWST